jgi:hypothetical protein
MKLATITLASALALSGTFALAQTGTGGSTVAPASSGSSISTGITPGITNGSTNGQSGGTLTNGTIGNSMTPGGPGITGINPNPGSSAGVGRTTGGVGGTSR